MLKHGTGFLKTLLRQNRTWKSAKVIKEAFLLTQRSVWINRAAEAWALPCVCSGVWGEEDARGQCNLVFLIGESEANIGAPAHTCDLPEAMLWMWTLGGSKTSRSWRPLCLWQDLCGHGAHSMRDSCPRKRHPILLQSLLVRMHNVWGRRGSSSLSLEEIKGRRQVRYSCFAVQLWFAVILSYFTCTDSSEEVILAQEDVPMPGIPGVPGQGHTVPSPSEGYDWESCQKWAHLPLLKVIIHLGADPSAG